MRRLIVKLCIETNKDYVDRVVILYCDSVGLNTSAVFNPDDGFENQNRRTLIGLLAKYVECEFLAIYFNTTVSHVKLYADSINNERLKFENKNI